MYDEDVMRVVLDCNDLADKLLKNQEAQEAIIGDIQNLVNEYIDKTQSRIFELEEANARLQEVV